MGVSGEIEGCWKEALRVFQGTFKRVSRMFQGSFKEVQRGFNGGFLRRFEKCFREFHNCLKDVL